MTGRLQQSKPKPIRRQRQFWNASVHKATVAGKILGVAYLHAQCGETLQGGGEPLEGVFIQHLVCPRKCFQYIGRTKSYHLWWPYLLKTGSWGCNYYLIGSDQQPELDMGWMITTKLISAQTIRNKLRITNPRWGRTDGTGNMPWSLHTNVLSLFIPQINFW